MDWTTVTFSMSSAVCLTLGVMQLLVWLRLPNAWDALLFSIAAFALALVCFQEWNLMHAQSPAEYGMVMRWAHLTLAIVLIALVWFIRCFLNAGRLWLAWLITGLRGLTLLPNFFFYPNATFQDISSLKHALFFGQVLSVPVGTMSPWREVIRLSALLFIVYAVDAAITDWNKGNRRRAMIVGGAVISSLVLAATFSELMVKGFLPTPFISLVFLLIILAMAIELSMDLLRSKILSKELQASQERMRLAANAASLSLWEWDIRRDRVWISETGRVTAKTGGSKKGLDGYIQSLHPDDRECTRQAVREAVDDGRELRTEFRMVSPSGKTNWFAARGRIERDAQGKPLHLRGITIDITKRKETEEALRESEARFRQVADSAPVMIWMSGTDMRYDYFNKRWLDFTGRPLEQELGNGWVENVHPDDLQHYLTIYTTSFEARREFSMQHRLRRKDGQYRWMQNIGVPRLAADGHFLGYIGSCVDITSQKEAEELGRVLAHIQRVSAMGQLSSTLAHELNQPLGAILRNAEAGELLLKQDLPDIEEVLAILADIRRDDQRASAVIDRMRSLLKRGKLTTEILPVVDVIGQVADLLEPEFQMRQVRLRIEVPPALPMVRGDRIHLQQVILNLLLNSLDAMEGQPNGQRQVIIRASESGDGVVEVSVIDRGTGVAPGKLRSIFEPFETSKGTGTGMGLAISKSIIELHDGQIWAENNPEGGATFRFTLAVAQSAGKA